MLFMTLNGKSDKTIKLLIKLTFSTALNNKVNSLCTQCDPFLTSNLINESDFLVRSVGVALNLD